MDPLSLRQVSAPDPAIAALLQTHFDLMRSTSPAESCHVLEPQSLFDEAEVVVTALRGDTLLGIGALARLDHSHGELKSMHTSAAARGQGIGAAVLKDLIDKARTMGLTRISLETGSADVFAPARALYAAHGFSACAPFGSYTLDPHSVFMTRTL